MIAAAVLAGAAAFLCVSRGEGLAESVQNTLGAAIRSLADSPRLGGIMDEKTASTVVRAVDLILDSLPTAKRFAFSALFGGVFAIPAG